MHRYLVLQAHKQEFACIEEVLKQKRIAENLPYLYEKYSAEIESLDECEKPSIIIQERYDALQKMQKDPTTLCEVHYQFSPEAQKLLENQGINREQFEHITGNLFESQLRKEQCIIIDQAAQLHEGLNQTNQHTLLSSSDLLALPEDKLDTVIQSPEQFLDYCLSLTTEATLLSHQATQAGHLEQAEMLNDYAWSMLDLCKGFMLKAVECGKETIVGFVYDGPRNVYELGQNLCGLGKKFCETLEYIKEKPHEAWPEYAKLLADKTVDLAQNVRSLSTNLARMLLHSTQAEDLMRAGRYEEAEQIIIEQAQQLEPVVRAIVEPLRNTTIPDVCRKSGAFISEGLITAGVINLAGKTYRVAKIGSLRIAQAAKKLAKQTQAAKKLAKQTVEGIGARELTLATPEGLMLQVRDKSLDFSKQAIKTAKQLGQDPRKVVQKIPRYIQTKHLKLVRLGNYLNEYLSKLKNPKFIKAKLNHIFGIDKLEKHRLSGMIEGKYSGYHHDKNWSLVKKGKVKFLTKPEICPKTGLVSVAKLEIEGVIVKNKTFFPPEWSKRKVIDKIVEASENIKTKFIRGTKIEYTGVTNKGMHILMVIDENKKLITAYPVK